MLAFQLGVQREPNERPPCSAGALAQASRANQGYEAQCRLRRSDTRYGARRECGEMPNPFSNGNAVVHTLTSRSSLLAHTVSPVNLGWCYQHAGPFTVGNCMRVRRTTAYREPALGSLHHTHLVVEAAAEQERGPRAVAIVLRGARLHLRPVVRVLALLDVLELNLLRDMVRLRRLASRQTRYVGEAGGGEKPEPQVVAWARL